MTGFNANDEEHQTRKYLDKEGRYVLHVIEIKRHQTRNDNAALWLRCEIILGDFAGQTFRRLVMIEGKGTSWTADLLKAVGTTNIRDIFDDDEWSRALGRRAFAANIARGEPHPTKLDRKTGQPIRYMELQDFFPISSEEQALLHRDHYQPGVNASVFVEEFSDQADRDKRKSSGGGGGYSNNSGGGGWGNSGGGGWGNQDSGPPPGHPAHPDAPSSADDDIPF